MFAPQLEEERHSGGGVECRLGRLPEIDLVKRLSLAEEAVPVVIGVGDVAADGSTPSAGQTSSKVLREPVIIEQVQRIE